MKYIALLICSTFTVVSNFYDLSFTGINGAAGSFNQFSGKKVLLVNIATGSENVSQIGQLEQLYQKYKDSLVIVAIPSNSFGNEARTNSQIIEFLQSAFQVHYTILAKGAVEGAEIIPVYAWLSEASANGLISINIQQDFQKVLIGTTGAIEGIFSSSTDPMDQQIQDAITGN